MSSQKDKTRVFVALYFREGITSSERSEELLGHAKFHWAIWTEPKGSLGRGCCYQVVKSDAFINVPDSGGWEYSFRRIRDCTRSGSMLGRIMVGKLPNDVGPEVLNNVLIRIPLPSEDGHSGESCVTWTVSALKELQLLGWAENFRVKEFMDHGLYRANRWYNHRSWRDRNLKENYALQRNFP
ncbi:hypothetical protein F4802DRAFT_620446 [Xylaria palmicola]|nr:hypothetical protein F4802DRAFT_620446 [Xylaria palmicola]